MAAVIRAAFCGAGGIVRGNHLPNLEERPDRFSVAGFYDIFPESSAKLAGDKYRAYASYDELLADKTVDLVIIATKPLSTHFPAAKQALDAGKHVLLEKPMAETVAECDELIALAKKKSLILTVHHNRRLNLDFLALRDVIASGKLGEVRLVENRIMMNSYNPGETIDWGVHLVDQSLILNGSRLREVSANMAYPENGMAGSGFLDAMFRFESGPAVRLAMLPRPAEYLINGTPPLTRFYAAGTKGSFVQRIIEGPRDLMNATQNFDGAKPDYKVPEYLEIKQKGYYDYLYESLAGGKELLVKPEEARNAMRAIELISKSAKTNRTVEADGMLKVS
jgi:predicted dehydrogenase